uniref:Nuclear factor 7, brain-like n=1 Tax=Astyanax mexicanus TaxID=7994 RepID=A0A8B9KFN8_ASTMX
MASMLSMQIQCPVCLGSFRDPVCLPCEHSYCRVCITSHAAVSTSGSFCPECRQPFSRDNIRVNRTLRNIVDAARAHLEEHEAFRERARAFRMRQDQSSSIGQCPDHDEAFRFFCETDQKLICVVCKEEARHQGHSSKSLRDALQTRKEKIVDKLDTLFSESETLVDLIEKQTREIIKTREKAKTLSNQISTQFDQMHQFLREKEEEVKALLLVEEDKLLDDMEVKLFTMEELLSDVRVNQGTIMSALDMEQPCQFLPWWSECGGSLIGETASSSGVLSPVGDLRVTQDSLFLGPYETHLQFFVWKEMLKSIKPVPHHPSMEVKSNQSMKVSCSGLHVQCRKGSTKNKLGAPWLKAGSSFRTGQNYWEVEVGQKLEWEVGICSCASEKVNKDTMLCYSSDSGYHVQQGDKRTVQVSPHPRKIGVYLDCARNQVSFYNADSMTLIDTSVLSDTSSSHSLCISPGHYLNGKNSDPVTVCWY